MTHIRALSLSFGVEVMLSYSDISHDETTVSTVNDETIEITLNGFSYHVSLTDFTEFVLDQVSMMRSIGC